MGLAKRNLILLAIAFQAHAADPWVIEGEAINSISGERLRKCSLELIDLKTGRTQSLTTNREGRFRFEGTGTGHYEIEARKSGFVDYRFGAALHLRPQASHNVTLKLIPLAILTGQVVDEDGDPWEWANLRIYQLRWSEGQLRVIDLATVDLNEKGEFRKAIEPGRYLLSAEPKSNSPYRTTWLGDTTDPDRATTIHLKPGDQRNGLLIQIQKPEKTWKISGQVTGKIDLSSPDLFRRPHFAVKQKTSFGEVGESGVQINRDGTFTMTKLLPGTYELTLMKGYPRTIVHQIEIRLANEDITGVNFPIPTTSRLTGQIKFAESSQNFTGQLTLFDRSKHIYQNTDVKNGSFQFDAIVPGSYRLAVSGVGHSWYLKEARIGNQLFKDGSVAIPEGEENSIDILLSTKIAQIVGSLSGEEYSPGSHEVIAFTEKREIRRATFDTEGFFAIDGLAPGHYRVIAIPKLDADEPWNHPRVNDYLFSQSTTVSLKEGEESEIKLTPLPKGKFEALLRESELQ